MANLEQYLADIDMDSIALPDDKLDECRYFYELLTQESERDKFRWLLSAFLGGCYSFLEIKAKNLYHAFNDHETGDSIEDGESLNILRQYVKAFQDKNNPSFIKTKGLHELIKRLYEIRNNNTHHYALSIMKGVGSSPETFLIGHEKSKAVPALEFCRQVLALFDEINEQLDAV